MQIYDNLDVELQVGPEHKVEVVAGEQVIQSISTVVKDGILVINNNNHCNFVRGYKRRTKIILTLPTVSKIENWGVGTTQMLGDFKGKTLSVVAESSGDLFVNGSYESITSYSNGNGDIYLSGNCDSLRVYMNGTNFLYGDSLRVNAYVNSETHSLGDCFVNLGSAKQLDFQIYRSGNIYYEGTPAVINDRSAGNATGKLLKKQ